MKKPEEQSIRHKTIRAVVVMAIMLIPIAAFMIWEGIHWAQERENTHTRMKMDALAELVSNENQMYETCMAIFDRNLAAQMKMMTFSLNKLVTPEGYTGPRILRNGFVVELQGEQKGLPGLIE